MAPLSLSQIRALRTTAAEEGLHLSGPLDEGTPLLYGTIRGSARLRSLIASTIAPILPADDLVATSGAISDNFLILDALCGPGDHVICQYPTYGQLFEVPTRASAEVDL